MNQSPGLAQPYGLMVGSHVVSAVKNCTEMQTLLGSDEATSASAELKADAAVAVVVGLLQA